MDKSKLEQIENIVDCIVKTFRNRDPFYIARKLGVKCTICELTDNTPAFSARETSDDPGTIFINSKLSSYSMKILCAHELGHLFFHEEYCEIFFDPEINPKHEYEANYFAAKLMPQIVVNIDISKLSVQEFNDYIAAKARF